MTDSCMLDVRGCAAVLAVTMSVSQCRVTHFHTLLHPAFSCRGLVPTRWDITMLESGKGQLQSPPHDGSSTFLLQSSHQSCVGNGDKNYPLQVRTCGYAIRSKAKLWVKPSLDGGCCRFAITNGHDSIPIWSLEKWADGSPAVSLIRAVAGEPFWIASAFQPSESPGQSSLSRLDQFLLL